MIVLFGLLATLVFIGILAPRVLYVLLIILAIPVMFLGFCTMNWGSNANDFYGVAFIAGGIAMLIIPFVKLFQKATPESPKESSQEKTEEKLET